MTWLNADGTTQASFQYPGLSLVVLDGEFWSYSSNSEMQRVDPTSGIGFGAMYTLPFAPPGGDPQWFLRLSREDVDDLPGPNWRSSTSRRAPATRPAEMAPGRSAGVPG